MGVRNKGLHMASTQIRSKAASTMKNGRMAIAQIRGNPASTQIRAW